MSKFEQTKPEAVTVTEVPPKEAPKDEKAQLYDLKWAQNCDYVNKIVAKSLKLAAMLSACESGKQTEKSEIAFLIASSAILALGKQSTTESRDSLKLHNLTHLGVQLAALDENTARTVLGIFTQLEEAVSGCLV